MFRSNLLWLPVVFLGLTANSCLAGAEGDEKKVAKKVDPSGTWKWERTFNDNKREFVLRLRMVGDKVTGTYKGRREAVIIDDVKMDGDKLSFEYKRESGDRRFTANYQGKVSEDTIKGTIAFSSDRGDREFEWEAKRSTELADVLGKWQFKIETQDGNVIEPSVTFSKEGDKVKGTYVSRYGERDATKIQVKDNELTFEISGENDGNEFKVVYTGKPRGNSIKGKVDYDFNGNAGSIDFTGKLKRALHLKLKASDMDKLPTKAQLSKAVEARDNGLKEEAKIDLFKAGQDGYRLYHIPGITVTAKGTVLAWCEARKRGSDWDDIHILLRRSTDDGLTWSKAKKIAQVDGPKKKNPAALRLRVDPKWVTYNNPVLIPDRDGTVHMVFCLEYERCFYQRSEDEGITWSKPVEVTKTFEAFRKDYDWKVLATGPNHSIQLKNGRLLVPVWLSTGTGGNAHRPSVTATIFSDDDGMTWQASEIAIPCTDEFINPNETVAVQLADGSVMLNSRNESKARRRIIVTSPDGATGWSKPRFQDDLIDPVCMGAMTRYNHKGKSLLLFTNPDTPRGRRNVTVRVSEDEGKTWPISRSIEPGWSAYSDVTVTQSGTILCFYGRSRKANFAGDRLTVARFTLDWMLEKDESP